MLIQPDTNILVLKDCPLDNTYEHTLYFDGETKAEGLSKQSTYFKGLKKYSFTKQSYQRYADGVLHIQTQAENLFDCNYLMFQNGAFGSKWFYAFITKVEYVNNTSCRVYYEIDVMQTWFFDYELGHCFVEREHSKTDNLFDNLVTENLDLGDDYVSNSTSSFDMNDLSVAILRSPIKEDGFNESITGRTVNGVYTPLVVSAGLPANRPDLVDAIVKPVVNAGYEDNIIAIYQYPSFLGDAITAEPVIKEKKITPNLSTIDGYTPNNKKLFCYPYNFLLVSNNSGQTAEYKWENWELSERRGYFDIAGAFVTTPSVLCYPRSYRGIERDYDSGLIYSNFPQCAWVGDAFKAWWAQNKTSAMNGIAASVMAATVSVGATFLNPAFGAMSAGAQFMGTMGATRGVVGSFENIASTVAKIKDLKNTPPQVHGQTQVDSLNCGINRVKFSFYNMSIKAKFAKIIDQYFDRYGYATHLSKIPNRAVRPHWTFTKTVGCTLVGSLPADVASSICKIYDNGITFWKKGSEVGNYSLNNKPT